MRARKTTQTKVEQGRRRDKVRAEMQKGLFFWRPSAGQFDSNCSDCGLEMGNV